MQAQKKTRVLFSPKRCTPVCHEVVDEVLGQLEEKRAAVVYLFFYDRVRHRDDRRVSATMAELSEWTGMDERTLAKCLDELEEKELIKRVRKGILHSRIHKPCWRVPLAEFSLKEGNWTPVPRFFITKYCRAFPNAVLLVIILRIQHMQWLNHSWVGITGLCGKTGWSPTRVRNALRTMSNKRVWKEQGLDLPRPLKIVPSQGDRRYFRVRAVWYRKTNSPGFSTIEITPVFRKRFNIRQQIGFETKKA